MLSLFITTVFLFLAAAPHQPTEPPSGLIFVPPVLSHSIRYSNGAVAVLDPVDLSEAGQDPQQQARTYFEAQLGKTVELVPMGIDRTSRGTVVHFVQVIQGVPVAGTYAMAVVDRAVLRYAVLLVIEPPRELDLHAELDPTTAVTIATTTSAPREVVSAHAPTLAIGFNAQGAAALMWRVPVHTANPMALWMVYVDAHSGAVLGVKHKPREGSQLVGSP